MTRFTSVLILLQNKKKNYIEKLLLVYKRADVRFRFSRVTLVRIRLCHPKVPKYVKSLLNSFTNRQKMIYKTTLLYFFAKSIGFCSYKLFQAKLSLKMLAQIHFINLKILFFKCKREKRCGRHFRF